MNFTHYHKSRINGVTLFELGNCECCGAPVVEANAIKGSMKDVAKYKRIGLREWSQPLPNEVDVDPNTGETVCEECADY